MKKIILKRIFFAHHQHREKFKTKIKRKIQSIVIKELEKLKDCSNPKNGFKLFFLRVLFFLN
ncbi:hypothetical protein B5V89_14915 [Heyndrickxia sporothermodurans]|nr:hypothetical protein B5V89_14915 [Heyndrickxia sporothermodurans]